MALLAGVLIAVAACDDSAASLSVGGPGSSGRVGSISENHGHVATLTAAQLDAGNTVTLDIRGTADHTHTVELGGSEVVQIRNGVRVTRSSSIEASTLFATHFHTVTFN